VATRFGAYEILHELKSGGMGAVLLGRRRGPGSFEQLVALKTIRPEFAGAPAVRAMFLDEAAILARVNHPGIAIVHDFGEERGTLYMAMEYVAGISFRALAELDVPPVIAARAVAEACRGLHAAHEVRDTAGNLLGVVHRDISPDNLMLGFDGHVKVIDFGIALVKNRQAPVTEFGTIKGKPPYMSPEQVKNETMDRRSDVFSLAVVLHEMITGQPLFDGDSIYAIARAVEHQPILPPSQVIGRSLPIGLDAVLLNALDRSLARRTPSAAALAEQLEQVIQAAGDETLEAWTERALAEPREAHRRWLAEVAAGREPARPVVGRATGAVTQLPPEQAAALAAIAPPVLPQDEPPPEPGASTHLPAAEKPPIRSPRDGEAIASPPRRKLGVPVLLALLVLLGVIGGVLLLWDRRGGPAPDAALVAAADAAVDAPPMKIEIAPADAPEDAVAPAPPDAAAVIAPPIDGPPADAARSRARADAGALTVARDAAIAADAQEPAPPAGTGEITIVGRGEAFLNILVDGHPFKVTPQLRQPIAAGRHTIALLDPKTNQVVYETIVVVEPGKHVRVQPP
jgi:serine/threonine-protein kinase